ncbi:nuclear transport factor 2 family protein [Arthrobacter sp. ISL-95]|uniref:nuclear transport factor 2 family protein n=1 Tax=Arthrobacter sp. ISL-95 TaxID=2819116 RepID=UPI001BE8E133|nr:nuclear transport factor 2 family protein [Arthrobacter sp. ISL-95]MBT2586423.1 nuclear transport factor 2 family protein [Arthrobacter sp. ISL-95]
MDLVAGLERVPDGPVRRMFAAAGSHDIEALVAEFSQSYINVTPNHPQRNFTGTQQVRANWTSLFAGIPDLALKIHDAVADDDRTVWVEWSLHGHRLDGSAVELAGVAIFAVDQGKLAGVHFYLEPVERTSGDVDVAVRTTAGPGLPVEPEP